VKDEFTELKIEHSNLI